MATSTSVAPFPSGWIFNRRKVTRGFLWLVIVAVASWLRFAPTTSELPYLGYVDEGHVLHQVLKILQEKTLDTGVYIYPSLPSYLMAGAVVAYSPIYRKQHGHDLFADLQRDDAKSIGLPGYYDYVAPTAVILLSRCVVALLSVGAVILSGVLATQLSGARAGLLALLLTALCPALVSRGSIVLTDTLATFFSMAALCFAQRLHLQKRAWACATIASVMAGFAFTSKYTGGAVLAAVMFTILSVPVTVGWKLRLLLLSGCGFVFGSILGMPVLLTKSDVVIRTVAGIAKFYGVIGPPPGYWGAAISRFELGLPLVLLGLAGIVFMIRRGGQSRIAALSWLVFAVVLLAPLVRSTFQPLRNLLPLVPLVCIAAALLLARGYTLLGEARLRRFVHLWLAPGVALLLALSLAFHSAELLRLRRSHRDSRLVAVDWLRENLRAGVRVLAIRELAIFPGEWKRAGFKPTVVSFFEASDRLERASFDYIITSDFDLQFATDAKIWAEYRDHLESKVSQLPIEAEFGNTPNFIDAGVWRTTAERIVIRRIAAERPAP